ncbi:MAG: hypothetical protein HY579_11045 [Nitrospinae bacterium]|nr:hypothetical protein [Nitrospinota bacterium]
MLAQYAEKIKSSPDIDPLHKDSPEAERSHLLSIIQGHQKNLAGILDLVEKKSRENHQTGPGLLANLLKIDENLQQTRSDIEMIAENQYACKLELYKQEIILALEDLTEQFDFIVPGIRNEMLYLEKHYRIPANISNSILPHLQGLLADFEKRRINLKDFINGYETSEGWVYGYNDLRSFNNVYSKYQYYDHGQETYKEINNCVYEICSAIEPLLYEKKEEDAELKKFFVQLIENKGQKIAAMKDIFEYQATFRSLLVKIGRKFSFREEFKKAKSLIDLFFAMQKSLVCYNDAELAKTQNELAQVLTGKEEIRKSQAILEELKTCIEEKSAPFHRIESAFAKLAGKDFNIVVQEKDVEDLTIKITPYLEEKFGKNLLERINIVIQEIDFWYPSENKQLLFRDLAEKTKLIQSGEANKEFIGLIQKYDQEIEKNIRKTYPSWINTLNAVADNFQNAFADKIARERLEKRLVNKEIWNDINPKFRKAKAGMSILSSDNATLKENVNKFPFIKQALEEFCQLFYDLSMQLFVLYKGLDPRSIFNMTNILSTFNEFHDLKSLSATFNHYFQKGVINNFHVNERVLIEQTQNPFCKAKLQKIVPEDA